MARFFKIGAISCWLLAVSCWSLTSCQEGSEAGDLLGQWRLGEDLYVSFSGSIARFRSLEEGQVFGNFQHVGDSLFIQCYSEKADRLDTIMIEDSFGFRPFNNIRLRITTIDSDELIVSQGSRLWSLKKY